MIADVPVDPDRDEARRWLEEELGRGSGPDPGETPGWWQEFQEWLRRLLSGGAGPGEAAGGDTGQAVGIAIAIVLVVALLVVAFAIFGLPRVRRRSKVTGDLFGTDDERSALQLRGVARQAAERGDYTTAVVELFRSLARDLAERGVVQTFPGTTARDFARRAGAAFPREAERLGEAASVFDGVRYLGHTGTLDQWLRVSALDEDLRAARKPRALRARDALGHETDEQAEVLR